MTAKDIWKIATENGYQATRPFSGFD